MFVLEKSHENLLEFIHILVTKKFEVNKKIGFFKWRMRNSGNLYTYTVLDGSVTLSVRYRNHFPVVQFQNQAHIRNPHDPAEVFKTVGAAGARNMGHRSRLNFFFVILLPPPKAS